SLFALACSPRDQTSAPLESPSAEPRGAAPPEVGIYYTFRVPRALDELEAEVCFRGPPPARLEPPMGDAAPFLARAHHGERSLAIAEGAIALEGVGDGDCVRYAVGTASLFGRDGARRAGEAALLSPDWWLWKPAPRGDRPIRARFEGVSAVVPWPEERR